VVAVSIYLELITADIILSALSSHRICRFG
jgi:hypothetical protein